MSRWWLFRIAVGYLVLAPRLVAESQGSRIVIMVHGAYGDARGTWKRMFEFGGVSPQLVPIVGGLTSPTVAPGSFYSIALPEAGPFSLPVSAARIREQGTALAGAVDTIRQAPGNAGREIVLVGHSRGGMVVRDYLERTLLHAAPPPVSDVVFFSTPHLLHENLLGRRPLPEQVRYYTVFNPEDRLVSLKQQAGLLEQQPGLTHRGVTARGWSGILKHEMGDGPALKLWAAVRKVARTQKWPGNSRPVSSLHPWRHAAGSAWAAPLVAGVQGFLLRRMEGQPGLRAARGAWRDISSIEFLGGTMAGGTLGAAIGSAIPVPALLARVPVLGALGRSILPLAAASIAAEVLAQVIRLARDGSLSGRTLSRAVDWPGLAVGIVGSALGATLASWIAGPVLVGTLALGPLALVPLAGGILGVMAGTLILERIRHPGDRGAPAEARRLRLLGVSHGSDPPGAPVHSLSRPGG